MTPASKHSDGRGNKLISGGVNHFILAKYPWGVYNFHKIIIVKFGDRITKEVTGMEKEQCCHCARTKERSSEEYKKLINRLSRIEGQIRGIRRMVEESAYCTDILVQSAAVTAAMNAFNKELLSNHIRTCVAEDIRSGKDETIDELVDLIGKMMK